MTPSWRIPEKLTDQLTALLSVAFAAGVTVFAAYKVTKLNGIEDPPVNMGLNFPALPRRVILDELAMADPMTTQSLGTAVKPRIRPAPEGSYALLAVIEGVAFVEVDRPRGKTLLPVTVGSWLPGGFRVEKIEKHHGRWRLVAGSMKLEQSAQPLQ